MYIFLILKPSSYFFGAYCDLWLGFISRNYWSSLDQDLMASIWEKANSILAGNLNSGRTYLIIAVQLMLAQRGQIFYQAVLKIFRETRCMNIYAVKLRPLWKDKDRFEIFCEIKCECTKLWSNCEWISCDNISSYT